MKTSRIDGILAMETIKPYKMAIQGNLEERTEIILKDITFRTESVALDLEQLLIRALTSLPMKDNEGGVSGKEISENEEAMKEFFSEDSPSEKMIQDQAKMLEMAVKINTSVKLSEIIQSFNKLRLGGLVEAAGGSKMFDTIWQTVSSKDRLRIVFWYCAFFVNPLGQLLDMEAPRENQK